MIQSGTRPQDTPEPGQGGGKPISYDPRDDKFTAIKFGAVSLPVFPKTLGRIRRRPYDQAWSQSCTQQAINGAAEYQDGVELNPAWSWSRYCKKVGNFIPQGADPRAAMQIAIDEGLLPYEAGQLSFPIDDQQIIGNWDKWPELHAKAEPYKKAAYIKIPKVNDHFDSIRTMLLQHKNDGTCVIGFGTWLSNWRTAIVPTEEAELSGYHAYFFLDFDTIDGVDYVVARNSYGTAWGQGGYQYFPREVINREFSKYGTGLYIMADLTPEQIALAKQETKWGAIQRAIIQIWSKLQIMYA